MKNILNDINEIEKSLLPWLGRTLKGLDFFIIDAFKKSQLNLTKAQLILLRILATKNGTPQHNLAFITNRDKASLARLISTMERKGLVTRKSSKSDKRVNHVFITDTGIQTLRAAMPVILNVIAKVQKGIGRNEMKTTLEVLEKIRYNINGDRFWSPETTKP